MHLRSSSLASSTSEENRIAIVPGTCCLDNELAAARVPISPSSPVGGHTWLGCLGYVAAAVELDKQAQALGIGDARLIVAAGSGGTLAGLLAGPRGAETRGRFSFNRRCHQ